MFIIDKNTDYYDYVSHVYGVDKKIVFDRRGSIHVSNETIAFNVDRFYYDNQLFFVLEIGYVQYILRTYNIKYKDFGDSSILVTYDIEIVRVFKDNKHYEESPISIHRFHLPYDWRWRYNKKKKNKHIPFYYDEKYSFDDVVRYNRSWECINLPILKNTKITSIIDPVTIWNEIQMYISSLHTEKDVSTSITDTERAEIHGFDKKTSFRHPITFKE